MNSGKNKILLAVDGSSQSLEAVRYASRVLDREKVKVCLFHVFSKIPEFFYDLGEEPQFRQGVATSVGCEIVLRDSINKFMSEARQILIDAGIPPETITIDIHDREKGVSRDIIAESSRKYSGIVVGRNGLNRINDFVLGSVANKLLQDLLYIPICVVGGKPGPEKVLLALDNSEGAMKAVNYVATILSGSTHELTLVNVVRNFDIFEGRFQSVINLTHMKEYLEEAKLTMRRVFEEARTRLISAGFNPNQITTKLSEGASSRAGAIVEEAREGAYGTIVVGRRGLSKVYEFLMGRVSSKVIQLGGDYAVWVVG